MINSTNLPESSGSAPNIGQIDSPSSPGRVLMRILLAIVVACLVIAAFVYFGRQRPAAAAEVARISVFPIHTTIRGSIPGATGMAGQDESYNQLLVFALVRVRNISKSPLQIDDFWAVLTLSNGQLHRSLAASTSDFERVFSAYPQLTPIKMDPLRRDVTIPPGGSIDGMLVFNYPVSQQDWIGRKSLMVTISFANAREITVRAPAG